jgi:lipoprotein-anchoring transpeptidase ErfK/SrfK
MPNLSRRDFLRMASCGLGAFALSPWVARLRLPAGLRLLRVTNAQLRVFTDPDPRSDVVYTRKRDELLNAYYQLSVDSRNPPWFRVWGGYAHSSFLQVVQMRLNLPLARVPAGGVLVEVSVPYTQSMLWDQRERAWQLNYRLYYGSTHWVTGVRPGPDGEPWYEIEDHFERVYYAAAEHLRPIPAEELAPITPEVAPADKWIEVDIPTQTLVAYEQEREVLRTRISSGVEQVEPVPPGEISSDTPGGDFHITVKTPSRHMGDKKLTGEVSSTALPGVPWVCFFKEEGYALHGTYWHANFGYKMSHGCINMPNDLARWVYRWTLPHIPPGERWFSQWGTRVRIIV